MSYFDQQTGCFIMLGFRQSSILKPFAMRHRFSPKESARRVEGVSRKADSLNFASNCVLSLCAVFVIVAVREWRVAVPGRSIHVENPVNSFGPVAANRVARIGFWLWNPTSEPVRILGSWYVCKREGCCHIDNLPVTIAPYSRRAIDAVIETRRPGRLDGVVYLWTDCPEATRLDLRIVGEVAEADRAILGARIDTQMSP